MKSLVFDSGPIIGLTMNSLLWVLEPLKKSFGGEFCLPESVRWELIDEPLKTKKFKFEALQVKELIAKGVLKVFEDGLTKEKTLQLLSLANRCYSARGRNLSIIHYAEVTVIALAAHLKSEAIVMDERVTREFIEHPNHLAKLTEKKLHSDVAIDRKSVGQFRQAVGSIKVIRSTELVAAAYEKGLLNRFATKGIQRKTVLESILWGLKIDGTAINKRGINAILNAEK